MNTKTDTIHEDITALIARTKERLENLDAEVVAAIQIQTLSALHGKLIDEYNKAAKRCNEMAPGPGKAEAIGVVNVFDYATDLLDEAIRELVAG